MTELFKAFDQQRRDLLGEAPTSLENLMMKTLLGDRATQQGLLPYEGVSRTHDHVIDLEIGRNLGHHVLVSMITSEVSTANLLPWQQVDPSTTFFEWTIEPFTPGILPHVPEEAPFPELTYRTEKRYVKMQRRGGGVRMTANIMNTPEGLARIQSQLIKLGATTLLTVEFIMLQALTTAHDGPMFRRRMTLDQYGDGEIMDQLSYDASRYASWNRVADIEVAKDMGDAARVLREYTQGPWAVLYPVGKASMLSGEVVESRLTMDVKTMNSAREIIQMQSPPASVRLADGSLAFAVPDYSFNRGTTRMQPLLRSTIIAEHYCMTGVTCNDLVHRTGAQRIEGGGFATCQRDIWVYDVATQDNYVRVSFMDAFKASGFVPEQEGDRADSIRALFERVGQTQYGQADFLGRRKAPSRVYWENGIKEVTHFAQFDANVVSDGVHRQVGATVAACVQAVEPEIVSALADGMALLRELVAAVPDPAYMTAVDGLFFAQGAAAPVITRFGDAAADLAVMYPGSEEILFYAQDQMGMVARADVATFEAEVNRLGTAPFMFSVAGLRLVSRLAIGAGAGTVARALGERARRLLDAAEVIYNILADKFPGSLALDARYRPLYHLPADGFATWFTNVFLNTGNWPIIATTPGGDVVLPYIVSERNADLLRPPLSIGTLSNPLQRTNFEGRLAVVTSPFGGATTASMRTTWLGHHDSFGKTAAAGLIDTGSASSQAGAGMRDVDDDDDLFSMQPVGAPIGGVPSRAMRRAVAGLERSPMASSRAQDAWNESDRIENPLVRICTMTYLASPCTAMSHFVRMMESDILVPFDIFLLRPGLVQEMYSTIVMKPGLDTGFHAVGDTVLDFGKNVNHQVRKITFSIRHATVLKAPDHVVILANRMARRYVSGGGIQLYTNPAQLEEGGQYRPDLIAFVVPIGTEFNRVEPMGGIDVDGVYGPRSSSRYADADIYESVWGLSRNAVESRANGQRYYETAALLPNYSWRGQYYNWNRELLWPAAGHRSGGSHPGCRAVWDGNRDLFPSPPLITGEI